MGSPIIILSSITYVHKSQDILLANKIRSRIVRLSPSTQTRGCGYGLEIDKIWLNQASALLERNNIRILEIINE